MNFLIGKVICGLRFVAGVGRRRVRHGTHTYMQQQDKYARGAIDFHEFQFTVNSP